MADPRIKSNYAVFPQPIISNKNKTKAQLFYAENQNYTRTADIDSKITRNLQLREQTGGPNASFNIINSSWHIQTRPFPLNQNFLGVKTSHYVPSQGRFKWDLSERNNSFQKVPDSQILFTRSQVPRAFS